MSRFFSERYKDLSPYTPGEQPFMKKYVKLNTNESPFPPSPLTVGYAAKAAESLNLYCDPDQRLLRRALSEKYGVGEKNVICGNGSDEILDLCVSAYCGKDKPAVFADVTYGFYRVFAQRSGVPYRTVPLDAELHIDPRDYIRCGGTVIIANPNAPTGAALCPEQIEGIIRSNPDSVVIVDEAYVDFGAESCVPLTKLYGNLIVTGTFSKSRSLAGGRLGYGIGAEELIADLDALRCSINPYNVNAMTQAAGIGCLKDDAYYAENCKRIVRTRAVMTDGLRRLGFRVADSLGNFVFAAHKTVPGRTVYEKLKENGVLVRYFGTDRISEYNRITVGSDGQTEALIGALERIL